MASPKPTKQITDIVELSECDVAQIDRMQLSTTSKTRKIVQDRKRSQYFLKGPLSFDYIRRMIPDPTSRVILVARAFADMELENLCVLSGKIWSCAVVGMSQRRRVLAQLRKMSPDLRVQDRIGRASVLFFSENS
jgi:hypothetical protein